MTTTTPVDLASYVRDVPDFPKPGIVFKDIMPLVGDAVAFRQATTELADWARPLRPDVVLGAEARGFVIGAALALELGTGFVTARKPGKLPAATVTAAYELEYGTDALEVHADAITPGQRVLVVDDLLATGGTAAASSALVTELGGVVCGYGFLIELGFLGGRARLLPDVPFEALIAYDGE